MTHKPETDDEAVKRLAWELCEADGDLCRCRQEPNATCNSTNAMARRAIELGAVPPPAPRDPVEELEEEIRKIILNPSPSGAVGAIAAHVHANFTRKAP